MNSFAVVKMLVTAGCLSGYFIPTVAANGEKCFLCAEGDLATCGTAAGPGEIACDTSKLCFEVHVQDKKTKAYAGTIRGCLANATDENCSGALVDEAVTKYSFIENTCHHCNATAVQCNTMMYTTTTQSPGSSNATTTTASDNASTAIAPASGHPPSYTGSAMLCALMFSLALARMSYNTAV